MPRDNKKRGRRSDSHKRKLDVDEDGLESPKRRKVLGSAAVDNSERTELDPTHEYGFLSESEQQYFKSVEDALDRDAFDSQKDKDLFLDNVVEEMKGKELTLIVGQSSSRLFERIVSNVSPTHVLGFYRACFGHFVNLIQHRFASHCCEALLLRSAQLIDGAQTPSGPASVGQLEHAILQMSDELDGHWNYLITDRFASHVVRVLSLVLAGEAESMDRSNSSPKRGKKDRISLTADKASAFSSHGQNLSSNLTAALEKLLENCVKETDTASLRLLATHQTGNPTLQILLRLELSCLGKQRAKDNPLIMYKLIPIDQLDEGSETLRFIDHLLYDSIGSRLLETIIQYAPSRLFKKLYKSAFKDRIGSLARNEIAGYVVCKMLERLSPEELAHASENIIPQIPGLVKRNRTNVIKTLVERATVRRINAQPLADCINSAFAADSDSGFSLAKLLDFPEEWLSDSSAISHPSGNPSSATAQAKESSPLQDVTLHAHKSALAQAMLDAPQEISDLIYSSLADLPTPTYDLFARHSQLSRVLQAALLSPRASLVFRRKLITRFYGKFATLSTDPAGSHLVDAIWTGTDGMAFLRERVAEELAEAEPLLRESKSGRAVWRNWRMDLYKRRRGDWVRQMKEEAGNSGFLSFPDDGESSNNYKVWSEEDPRPKVSDETKNEPRIPANQKFDSMKSKTRAVGTANGSKIIKPGGKSGLQLAREKFVRAKLKPPVAASVR